MNYLYRILDKLEDYYLRLESFSDPSPFGKDTQVFWIRRNQIFPNFDRGFQTDAVGLFSATPQKIADEVAHNAAAVNEPTMSRATLDMVDAFCGIGANAIAFAKAGKKVYAVDLNQQRLNMAKHNAELEGLDKNIIFTQGDIFSMIGNLPAEAIFLDPPWGGVNYLQLKDFGFKDFEVDVISLLHQCFKKYRQVILKVPRQFDMSELDQFGKKYTVQENRIRSKVYCRTVYFE